MRSIAKNSDFRVSKADDRAKGEDHPQHTHAKAVIKTDCLKLNKDYMKKFPQFIQFKGEHHEMFLSNGESTETLTPT